MAVYLDVNMSVLRSFELLLGINDVITTHQDDNSETACNAVIIGKGNASFVRQVYDSYKKFSTQFISIGPENDKSSLYDSRIAIRSFIFSVSLCFVWVYMICYTRAEKKTDKQKKEKKDREQKRKKTDV